MHTFPVLFLLLTSILHNVESECSMHNDQCEFSLEISSQFTMMHDKAALYAHRGKLYKYDVPEDETDVTEAINPDDVIVADGWETPRLVTVANNVMPAPSIEVYEGQTVVIHVKNNLLAQGVSMHWHGLPQKGTPWMDGVSFITQCPIDPGQSFTYRFNATPPGSYWYHSHEGSQPGNGLAGAFIIRERKPLVIPEHIMVLQDWNHEESVDDTYYRMMLGNFAHRKRVKVTRSLVGALFSAYPFHSGLINGRGRYMQKKSSANLTPLTEFKVDFGMSYRFRVVGAQNQFPFRVSVDDHMLILVASDANDLRPVVVESFIINPGERYDFVITANQTVGNYWIRTKTLEVNVIDHMGLAILRYDGAPYEDPTSERKKCTQYDTCIVANCPFSGYPLDQHITCMAAADLNSAQYYNPPGVDDGYDDDIEDIFLNFGFTGQPGTPSSVNGIKFVKPPSPPLTQPGDISTYCSPSLSHCEDQKTCECTSSITLDHGKVYNFIFTNIGAGRNYSHPIHMHGHSFSLIKMGFPPYDILTGELMKHHDQTSDIYCPGGTDSARSYCNNGRWRDSSWGGNNIPGADLEHPPLKDTVIVPTGGYAVVRLKADNPGVWYMHCHIDFHHLSGMVTMINESFPLQPDPPEGFRTCGNFP